MGLFASIRDDKIRAFDSFVLGLAITMKDSFIVCMITLTILSLGVQAVMYVMCVI